ncbi:MAG: hypothetical protein ACK52I_01990 [Pseudomonadota bacterium]|jgi:hypothetical protein
MKNPIELLQEVKKLVFQEETAAAPSYSLEDGTKIMIDKLEVGGVVTLEDGTPAPAGEHTLADGTKIVLAEGGVIAEIMPKEVEEKVEIEIESKEDEEKKKEEEEMKKKIAEMEGKFSAYETSFSALQSDYEGLKAAFGKQSEAMQGLISLVETLVNVPSQAPAEVPNNFKKHSASTKEDKIRSYSQFVSQFKK